MCWCTLIPQPLCILNVLVHADPLASALHGPAGSADGEEQSVETGEDSRALQRPQKPLIE